VWTPDKGTRLWLLLSTRLHLPIKRRTRTKGEEMKAVSFNCPDCNVGAFVHMAIIHNFVLFLIATCPECDKQLRFNCDKVFSDLYEGDKETKGN